MLWGTEELLDWLRNECVLRPEASLKHLLDHEEAFRSGVPRDDDVTVVFFQLDPAEKGNLMAAGRHRGTRFLAAG